MKKILVLLLLLCSMTLWSKTYTISNEGIEFIKKYEKCVLKAYPDAGGWTIGWGHHGSDVHEGMIISKKIADELFVKDIKKFETSVNRLIDALPYEYEFSQGFIDGLYSLVYNCGEGGVKKSTFYQRLLRCRVKDGVMNEEDFKYTVSGVKISKVSAPGHVKRRKAEYLMMLN